MGWGWVVRVAVAVGVGRVGVVRFGLFGLGLGWIRVEVWVAFGVTGLLDLCWEEGGDVLWKGTLVLSVGGLG